VSFAAFSLTKTERARLTTINFDSSKRALARLQLHCATAQQHKPELDMQNQIQTLEIVDTVRELSLEDIEVVSGGNGTTDFPIHHRG
jgi:hypothetical protein